jgi:hypothetical protein
VILPAPNAVQARRRRGASAGCAHSLSVPRRPPGSRPRRPLRAVTHSWPTLTTNALLLLRLTAGAEGPRAAARLSGARPGLAAQARRKSLSGAHRPSLPTSAATVAHPHEPGAGAKLLPRPALRPPPPRRCGHGRCGGALPLSLRSLLLGLALPTSNHFCALFAPAAGRAPYAPRGCFERAPPGAPVTNHGVPAGSSYFKQQQGRGPSHAHSARARARSWARDLTISQARFALSAARLLRLPPPPERKPLSTFCSVRAPRLPTPVTCTSSTALLSASAPHARFVRPAASRPAARPRQALGLAGLGWGGLKMPRGTRKRS